jgi:hypothetical protein
MKAERSSPGAPPADLTAVFDKTSYPPQDDSLAYCLTKFFVGTDATSAPAGAESDGPGVELALVLDVSGSMDKPNRFPLLCDAVRRLVAGLRSQDWISITLFTDRSETVFPFMPVEQAAADPDQVIEVMRESGLLFGPRTNLAPGLRLALDGFGSRQSSQGRVRRMYVLTDGELHDMRDCEDAILGLRARSVEVHVYGFGDEFNAVALKQLVSDQIGGAVKPILSEADITRTFAHVAAVNRRLIGTDAKLEVTFSPEVGCGDVWVFQPQGRYLGAIRDRRVEHLIGGIESGRWYSLLFEIRLPPSPAAIGIAEVSWNAGNERLSRRTELTATRTEGAATLVPDVRRAVDILRTLRAGNDSDAKLASYKARRELAILENRDPELIAALDKLIAGLTSPPAVTSPVPPPVSAGAGARVQRSALEAWTALVQRKAAAERLTERERLIIESDPSTCVASDLRQEKRFSEVELMYELLDVFADAVASGLPNHRVIELAVLAARKYVSNRNDARHAMIVLNEFSETIGVPAEILFRIAERVFDHGG